MISELNKEYKETVTITESNLNDDSDVKLEFSTKNQGKQFFIMLKGLYSNPLGSLIRELTSNCFDAYAELGIFDKPVFINFDRDDGGYYLEFIDEGVGMDSNRIHNIYLKVTESTKENDLNTIGSWGLGSKSPLAYYMEQIYVDTVCNGLRNQFIVFINDNYLPTATFLVKDEPVDDEFKNGTKVKVYIEDKDYFASEVFYEIKLQLAYFDNVITNYKIPLVNDYTIYEDKEGFYKYRPDVELYSGNLHIALGKVNYPLDIKQLNITYNELHPILKNEELITKGIEIPVALKFNIGEIDVTPSRESIRYTNKTKEAIKNKLINFFKYLHKYANNKESNVFKGNIFHYDKLFGDNGNNKSKFINLTNNKINKFIEISRNSPFFDLFSYPKFHKFTEISENINIKSKFLHSLIEEEYAKILNENLLYKVYIHNSSWKIRNSFNNLRLDTNNQNIYYINKSDEGDNITDNFTITPTSSYTIKGNISKNKIKLAYLNNSIIIAIPKITSKYNFEKWRIALGIPKKSVNIATTLKKVKNIIIEELKSLNIRNYNEEIEIPEIYIQNYISTRLTTKSITINKKVRIKNIEIPVRDLLLNTSRDINVVEYNDDNYTGIILYGSMKDTDLLTKVGVNFLQPYLAHRMQKLNKNPKNFNKIINVFRISEANFKHFEMNRNAIHVKLFNNEHNKLLLNAAVARLIESHRYSNIVKRKNLKYLNRINRNIYQQAKELENFIDLNANRKGTYEIVSYLYDFLIDNKDKDAIKNHEMLVKYHNILNYFTDNVVHTYSKLLDNNFDEQDDLIHVVDLLKQNNVRIDNEFYLTTKPKIKSILESTTNIIVDANTNLSLAKIQLSDKPFPENRKTWY